MQTSNLKSDQMLSIDVNFCFQAGHCLDELNEVWKLPNFSIARIKTHSEFKYLIK